MLTDKNGNKWYKGNLHTHTKNSDGARSPEDAIRLYKDRGYDFLALTDHWHRNAPGDFEGMMIISGAEYDVITADDACFHIVGYFLEKTPRLEIGDGPQKMIDEVKRCGGVATLAHPAWSLQRPHEMAGLKGVDCTEIYNSVSGYPFSARPYSGELIDVAMSLGFRATLTAADDTHYYKEDLFRGFVYVKADSLCEKDIKNAILKGDVLATQGPFAEWEIDGNDYVVRIPGGCEHVQFFSSRFWNPDTTARGGTVYEARYRIKSDDIFIRAEIVDFDGKTAYTQPYFIK